MEYSTSAGGRPQLNAVSTGLQDNIHDLVVRVMRFWVILCAHSVTITTSLRQSRLERRATFGHGGLDMFFRCSIILGHVSAQTRMFER